MGAVLGLVLGIGIVLIVAGLTLPRPERRERHGSATVALLARAGMRGLSPRVLIGACIALALSALVAVQALSRTLPVALAFAVIAGYLPLAVLRSRARRRQREFAEVWPEVVDHLASGVRAGLGLAEALAALAVRGPEPLRPAFSAFARDYQVSGRLTEALDRLKDLLADPVGDRVVEALRIAREVGGGDLGRLLRNLSVFLREDARTRSELESRQAWTVNGARLAISAPWLVLLMLSFQHEVIRRYATPAGMLVLVVGGATSAAAYWLMMRIGRLPAPRRIFG
ncbi:MAG TPA: type II secretion system F family protein [Marmoricola sp.]|jgi:tight adherence protein B|nr:type II secretion system F family protein [Marmoricola sp.]